MLVRKKIWWSVGNQEINVCMHVCMHIHICEYVYIYREHDGVEGWFSRVNVPFFFNFHMVLTITLLGKISRLLIRICIGDRDSGIRPAYEDIISYRSVQPL